VLLGPSGCGKTTTLRMIAGFEVPDSGSIEIAGRPVSSPVVNVPPERRKVGMVFQDYAIFPHLTVASNVGFALGSGEKARARTATLLEQFGLAEHADKMPHELSGGQQQRVALARALSLDPTVLLLDEPFSNLDTALRQKVRWEVRQLLRDNNATAVFVTHDQEEALFIGDVVAVMNDGCLEQIGTPEDIFQRPATRFVAEFLGQTSFLPGQATELGVETKIGLLPFPVQVDVGANVELAVRPDDIHVQPAMDGGNATITDRRYLGIAYIFEVVLDDGTSLRSWQEHLVTHAIGDRVTVRVQDEHPLACFQQGAALSLQ